MENIRDSFQESSLLTERAKLFGKSSEEISQLLGGFSTYLMGEISLAPLPKNQWVDEEDLPLVRGDYRIDIAQAELERARKTKDEDAAIERSRVTEWVVLLEKFIEVTTLSTVDTDAA